MAYFLLRNSKFMILEPRLDRNNRARRILLYVRKKMITKLLSRHSFPHDIELLLIEWRLRKEKWQISCCYNRHENLDESWESSSICYKNPKNPSCIDLFLINSLNNSRNRLIRFSQTYFYYDEIIFTSANS